MNLHYLYLVTFSTIPRKLSRQTCELYHMHSVKYSTEEFVLERPLITAVLDFADQQPPSVIQYWFLHALTVYPDLEGPTHSAHHRSVGIDSRDSEPGV